MSWARIRLLHHADLVSHHASCWWGGLQLRASVVGSCQYQTYFCTPISESPCVSCREGQETLTILCDAEGLPLWFAKSEAAATPNLPATSGDELKDGKYGVVRSLLRVLEGGTTSKEIVDHVIDACR